MEHTYPTIAARVPPDHFPLVPTPPQPSHSLQWLLELEIDGTIRYSNIHPQSSLAYDREPVVGANFFELQNIGGLGAFRRDFVGFVKGDKNRQTFCLRTGDGVYNSSTAVVLTRSFDKNDSGQSSVVVLMELKRA